MDKQAIFDRTLEHLRVQGHRSVQIGVDKIKCKYRSGDGVDACAIGIHIPRAVYSKELEDTPVKHLPLHVLYESFGTPLTRGDVMFLRELQKAHDSYMPLSPKDSEYYEKLKSFSFFPVPHDMSKWEQVMKEIAEKGGLKYSEPREANNGEKLLAQVAMQGAMDKQLQKVSCVI